MGHKIRRLSILICLTGSVWLGLGCPEVKPIVQCDPVTNEPCFDNPQDSVRYACDPSTLTCLRGCASSSDCLSSQRCDLSDPSQGFCRLNSTGSDDGQSQDGAATDGGDTLPAGGDTLVAD